MKTYYTYKSTIHTDKPKPPVQKSEIVEVYLKDDVDKKKEDNVIMEIVFTDKGFQFNKMPLPLVAVGMLMQAVNHLLNIKKINPPPGE